MSIFNVGPINYKMKPKTYYLSIGRSYEGRFKAYDGQKDLLFTTVKAAKAYYDAYIESRVAAGYVNRIIKYQLIQRHSLGEDFVYFKGED